MAYAAMKIDCTRNFWRLLCVTCLLVLGTVAAPAQAPISSDPIRLDNLKSVSDVTGAMRRVAPDLFQFSIQNGRNTPVAFVLQRHRHNSVFALLSLTHQVPDPMRLIGSDGSVFAATESDPSLTRFTVPANGVVTYVVYADDPSPVGFWLWSPIARGQFLDQQATFRNIALISLLLALTAGSIVAWFRRSRRALGAMIMAGAATALLFVLWKDYWLGFAPLVTHAAGETLLVRFGLFWGLMLIVFLGAGIMHMTLARGRFDHDRYWGFVLILVDTLALALFGVWWLVFNGVVLVGPITNDAVDLMLVLLALLLAVAPLPLPRREAMGTPQI